MQPNKNSKNQSELQDIAENKIEAALCEVMDQFKITESFRGFNYIKRCGLAVASGLMILLILPFYGADSLWMLYRCNINKPQDFDNKKDAYYAIKNNEKLGWRLLLSIFAARFRFLVSNEYLKKEGVKALILDDTLLEKTGKCIEGTSYVHDHVTKKFVLGFKLLVCGFWDGGSFIPLDFSLHREGSKKLKKHEKRVNKLQIRIQAINTEIENCRIKIESQQQKLQATENSNTNKTTKKAIKTSKSIQKSIEKLNVRIKKEETQLQKTQTELEMATVDLNECKKYCEYYGLGKEAYDKQFKKTRARNSNGNIRKKELDSTKIDNGILMLQRAVKQGFIPNYVLTDSWFFCLRLLKAVIELGRDINLISMAKIGTAKYKLAINNMEFTPIELIAMYKRHAQYNRKLKTHYIQLSAYYQDIRVNIFLIQMGRTAKWKLLVTTDLKISFLKLIEVYQIRWSIEVFFKENKQYLLLGKCQSTDFDAHIADISLSFIRHIMLSYYKRIHYQQSIGGLFVSISQSMQEASLAQRLWNLLVDLLKELAEMVGIDISEIFIEMLRNKETQEKVLRMLHFEKVGKVA